MTADGERISLRAVGTAYCAVPDEEIAHRRRELVSEIRIFDEFSAALRGIEQYSHLIVLFWMHRAGAPDSLLCHPRGDQSVPATGVFAARGRNHPNPIGLAVVELLEIVGTRLSVRKLDAYNGTPILDLKPYDDYDVVNTPRVPDWFRQRARKGA